MNARLMNYVRSMKKKVRLTEGAGMPDEGKVSNNLQSSDLDALAVSAKALASLVPFVGPLLSEVVSAIIPNQRLDRISCFLTELEKRVGFLESNFKDNKYAIDLFEDAIKQAARTLTKERNDFLAIFISNLGNIQSAEHSMKKKLLYILEELTDLDVEILQSFRDEGAFSRAKYNPPFRSIADIERLDDRELINSNLEQLSYDIHVATLERLGLLEPEMTMPRVDESGIYVDIDKERLPKKIGENISLLGETLLLSIDA